MAQRAKTTRHCRANPAGLNQPITIIEVVDGRGLESKPYAQSASTEYSHRTYRPSGVRPGGGRNWRHLPEYCAAIFESEIAGMCLRGVQQVATLSTTRLPSRTGPPSEWLDERPQAGVPGRVTDGISGRSQVGFGGSR